MRRNAEEKSEAARIPILKCKGFWTVINAQRTKRRSKDAESAAAAQFRSERNLQFRTNYFTFRNSGLEKLAAGGGRGRRSSTGGRGLRRSNDFCMCGLAAEIPSFCRNTFFLQTTESSSETQKCFCQHFCRQTALTWCSNSKQSLRSALFPTISTRVCRWRSLYAGDGCGLCGLK